MSNAESPKDRASEPIKDAKPHAVREHVKKVLRNLVKQAGWKPGA